MLAQQDIDGLLSVLAASQESADPESGDELREVAIYDFTESHYLPREFVHTLMLANLSLARSLANWLTGFLMASVKVETTTIEQMTYRQFCHAVPDVTALAAFSLTPLDGFGLVELNPHLAWYMIDRGLGGVGDIMEAPRDFTPLEIGLLEDLFKMILREVEKGWDSLSKMRTSLREIVSDPTLLRSVQPDDRMVVSGFTIALPGLEGTMNYAMPINRAILDRLQAGDNDWSQDDSGRGSEIDAVDVMRVLEHTSLRVKACFPDFTIPVNELASLREGDVITIDARVDDPMNIRIGDRCLYLARPLHSRDVVAMELLEEVEDGNG